MQKVNRHQLILFYILVITMIFLLSSCKKEEFGFTDQLFSRAFRVRNNYDDLQILSLEKYTYLEVFNDGLYSYENEWSIYAIKYMNVDNKTDYDLIYTFENNTLVDSSSLKNIDLWKNDFPKIFEMYNIIVLEKKYKEYKEYKEDEWVSLFNLPIEV